MYVCMYVCMYVHSLYRDKDMHIYISLYYIKISRHVFVIVRVSVFITSLMCLCWVYCLSVFIIFARFVILSNKAKLLTQAQISNQKKKKIKTKQNKTIT